MIQSIILIKQPLKVLFILYLCLLSSFHLFSQNGHLVNGYGKLLKEGSLITLTSVFPFRSAIKHQQKIYTSYCRESKFSFTITCKSAEFYSLSVNGKTSGNLFLGPGKADLEILDSNLKQVCIFNNEAAVDYESFLNEIRTIKMPAVYWEARDKYDTAHKNDDELMIQKWGGLIDSFETSFAKGQSTKAYDWLKAHLESTLNPFLIKQYLLKLFPAKQSKRLFNELPPLVKLNSWGKELSYFYENLSVGAMAPSFMQKDSNSNSVRLSDFRGRFVLLDFWASWCYPCRKANPFLVHAYHKFKNKGFTIISVSLDTDRRAWTEAIQNDNLHWLHVSDLQGWKNEVVPLFQITAIPNNILLNKQGRIVAKNIAPDNLEEEIKKWLQ